MTNRLKLKELAGQHLANQREDLDAAGLERKQARQRDDLFFRGAGQSDDADRPRVVAVRKPAEPRR